MFGRGTASEWAESINDWSVWLGAQNRSPTTIRQWRWLLRRFAEAHLRRSPWKITTRQIYTWYARQGGWSAGTMRSARTAIRSYYAWAQVMGRCRRNPARDLPPVVVSPGLPRPAAEAVIVDALGRADDKLRLMILLGAKAGLRCAEIASLRWVNVGPAMIRVQGKGGRERLIDLHPDLAAALEAERARRLRGAHGTGWRFARGGAVWVFPGQGGGHMAPRYVSQVMSAALGPGTTAHMLRHRAATRGLEATGDLAAVQDLLGHASPTTTRVYARTSYGARRAVIDSL